MCTKIYNHINIQSSVLCLNNSKLIFFLKICNCIYYDVLFNHIILIFNTGNVSYSTENINLYEFYVLRFF